MHREEVANLRAFSSNAIDEALRETSQMEAVHHVKARYSSLKLITPEKVVESVNKHETVNIILYLGL